jgi:hypothetical protein
MSVTNSTLVGNVASILGGGIGIFNGATVTLTHSTLSGNSAAADGGGGIYLDGANTLNIANTIIANSTSGGDFGPPTGSGTVNVTSPATAAHNLVSQGTFAWATTKTSAEINLSTLANNGGATSTLALLSGSVAIGTGNATISNAAPVSGLDQRGTTRSATAPSIGAFEGQNPANTPTFATPTSTANGFTVQISNYDGAFTYGGTATASGTVAISGTGLVTVSGVAANTSSTATITTTRAAYVSGSAQVTATSATTPTVTSPTSASVGTTSATLGGNVTATGGASLTAVGVVYSVTSANNNPQLSGTGVTNVTGTAATGVFPVSATGLTAGTAYSYAAYASNSQGTTYSSVGTFTTTVPTPTLTFTTPTSATVAVGATRTNAVTSTLSGGSYGAITYTSSNTSKATVHATTGVVTGVAVGTTIITATQAAASGYNATATNTYTLTVTIGTPTITAAPTATGLTYGQTLASSTLSGGTASVAGTFTFTTTSTAPSVGTAAQGVTFTPSDTTNYTSTTTTANVTVAKATPTLTWATPSAITYGTTLSATQLNATSSLADGTITYSPASGTTPSAGTQTLTATFTPTDTANYNTATGTVSLTVNKATPTLTWATPSTITYGTALSATQLNATASVAGSFAYSPASGAILSVGTQTLSATFTPTDTTNFNSASASVSLNVIVAVPGAPTAITATTANGEATVTFTAPSYTGSSAITGYTIRATATDGSTVTVNAAGSPAKVTGLTPGKSYRFTITANNSAGSSDASTTTDALTISLVNQTITFALPTDRTSNSGSFALTASASSGLPVTFTVVSGPALLSGNVVDLTGATGTVKIRASQTGNATYAAATDVDVAFAVTTGQLQVIFGKVVNSESTAPMADLAIMLRGTTRTGSILLVSNSIPGLNGAVDFTLTTGGGFSTTLVTTASNVTPLDSGIQAAPATYTITGTLLNSVFSGTISPLGLVFRANVTALVGPTAAVAGFYKSTALLENSGVTYSVIGANNEVLALTQNSTVTAGGLTNLKSDNTFSLTVTTTSGNAMLNGSINSSTTTAYATLAYSGATVNFAGLSVTTTPTDRLINLSSRAKVGTGESVLITGFVIGGTDSKKVLIRAAGPALSAFGLASTLPNPAIKIYQGSNLIAQNDDWNKDDAAEISRLGAFAFAAGSKDAALLTTLAPGAYTAQITDPSGTGTGVALAEIYDASINPNADFQRLVNISSRGRVTPDDGVLIGGFVVTGNSPKTLLIRGIGPALTNFGVAGALADPALTIYQDSKAISTNEGWANSAAITTAAIQTGAFMLPTGSKDAAVVITLNPGAYTAQIKSAKNASSGVALIEIYEVP